MRILVIGGTLFVGRHAVAAALSAGHEVTLLHRTQGDPPLFPEAEHRLADRNADLSVLSEGEWDATIDTCAYFPRQVRLLGDALGGRGGHYVHVSSVSAYATPPTGAVLDEDLPLAVLDDPSTEVVDNETYGPLKAACELASREAFGEPVSIVRPTYVVGPYDYTYRFTYWVERIARGGRVLAPGPATNPFQAIDGRDLGTYLVELATTARSGAFHAVSPAPPYSFGDFLEEVARQVAPKGTELVWVDGAWLTASGMTGAGLPLWAGSDEGTDLSAMDPSRAIASGLRTRPLAQTIRELHDFERAHPTRRDGGANARHVSTEREAEILSAWDALP